MQTTHGPGAGYAVGIHVTDLPTEEIAVGTQMLHLLLADCDRGAGDYSVMVTRPNDTCLRASRCG